VQRAHILSKTLIMKNLKIKFGLFSLLVIFAASVFLTSCQQEVVTDVVPNEQNLEHIQQIPDFDRSETIDMPKGFDVTNNEKVLSFLTNITEEETNILRESYRIKTYLKELNKYDLAYENMSEGDLFTDLNLNSLLSESELLKFGDFTVNISDLDSRFCWNWEYCEYYPSSWLCGNNPLTIYRDYCNGNPTGLFAVCCPDICYILDWSEYNLPMSYCQYP